MNAYAKRASQLRSEIEGSIESLNTLARVSNAGTISRTAKTREAYDSILASYNTGLSKLNTNIAEYNIASSSAARVSNAETISRTATRAQTMIVGLVNPKDKNEHLAGGVLGPQGSMPGGPIWSPTATAKMEVGKPSGDQNANLLNGNILGFLDYGFGKTQALLMGGQLDLMFDDDKLATSTVEVTVTVYDMNGNMLTSSTKDISSEGGSITGDGVSDSVATGNVSDAYSSITNAWNGLSLANMNLSFSTNSTFSSLTSVLNFMTVVSVYNMVTNERSTFEQKAGAGVTGAVMGMFTGSITQGVVGMLGFSTMSVAQTFAVNIGVSLFVAEFVSEVFEYATGVDTHFGFGGDFLGVNLATGEAENADAQDFSSGMGDFFGALGETLGFGDYVTATEMQRADLAVKNELYEMSNPTPADGAGDQGFAVGLSDAEAFDAGKAAYNSVYQENYDMFQAEWAGYQNKAANYYDSTDRGGEGNGNDDGGYGYGGDGGGTWICTATKDYKLIDNTTYRIMKRYGIALRRDDPYLMITYDVIGKKYAKLVTDKGVGKSLALFFVSYFEAKHTNAKLTVGQSVFDVLSVYIIRPIYRLIGKYILKG